MVFILFPFITTVRTMQCTAPLWETQYLPGIQNQWEQSLFRKGQHLPPAQTRSLLWHFPPWRSDSAGSGVRVPSLVIDRKRKLLTIKKHEEIKSITAGNKCKQAEGSVCITSYQNKCTKIIALGPGTLECHSWKEGKVVYSHPDLPWYSYVYLFFF